MILKRWEAIMRWALLVPGMLCAAATDTAQQIAQPREFTEVRANDIKWMSNPTLPGSEYAVLLGDPRASGPLVVRVRMPPGVRVLPHTHPESRTYTVLTGEWKLGFGDTFNEAALRSYPAGSLYRLPKDVAHFQATGAMETIVQIESIGPSDTVFLPKK